MTAPWACARCRRVVESAGVVRPSRDVVTLEGAPAGLLVEVYGAHAETCPTCGRQLGLDEGERPRVSAPVATVGGTFRIEAEPGALLPRTGGCLRCVRVMDVLSEVARSYRPDGVHAPWAFRAVLLQVIGGPRCWDCGRSFDLGRAHVTSSPRIDWDPDPTRIEPTLPRLDCPMCDAFVLGSLDRGVEVTARGIEIPWGTPELHYGIELTRAGFACPRCGRHVCVEEHPRGVSNVAILERHARHAIGPGPIGPVRRAPEPLAPPAVPVPAALLAAALPTSFDALLASLERVFPNMAMDPSGELRFPGAVAGIAPRALVRSEGVWRSATHGIALTVSPAPAPPLASFHRVMVRYEVPLARGAVVVDVRRSEAYRALQEGERPAWPPNGRTTVLLLESARAVSFAGETMIVHDHRPSPPEAFWVAYRTDVIRRPRVERDAADPELRAREAASVAEAIADPEADRPRRDLGALFLSCGDARGHLVDRQLRAATYQRRGELVPRALRDDIARLVAEHGARVAAPIAHLATAWEIRRGLVEHVTLPAHELSAKAEALYALAPIRHLTVTDLKPVIRTFFESPHLERLVSLGLAGNGLDDDDVAVLASSPRLARLRWLDLSNNAITRAGLEALAASAHLPALRTLVIRKNPCGDPTPSPPIQDGWADWPDPSIPELGRELVGRFGPRPWLTTAPPASPADRDYDPEARA